MSKRDHEYEGMNPRQRERMRPRKKGGVAGKIIAAVLGFLFGIIAAVGSVAGVGYYFATTTTVKDAINTVNDLAGTKIDYKEYVTDEYASQTVIGLVGKLQKVADDITKNGGSFEDLNKISPKVATAIDLLAKTLKDYGSSMEQSEINNKLMTEKFDSLGLALEEIIYTLQIGVLLQSTNNLDTKDELMMRLLFGEEGEDETSGDYHLDKNGKVVVHENANPITIGSLATGGINDVLADIPLDALIDESELNEDNPVMLALAYGTEGTHWDWKNGEAEMNQQVYTKGLAKSNETFYDIDGNDVTAQPDSEDPSLYSVSETDEESGETSVFYLKLDETTGEYLAWKDKTCTSPLLYPKTTVGDLQSGAGDLIDGIELAPIFGVSLDDIKKAHDSDSSNDPDTIILALAYGEKGTHYDLDESGEVVWIGDNKPRTISSLTDGGASALLDEIKLSTLLDISPLDKYTDPDNEPDPIMLTLAFGEEGTHYNLKDENGDGTPDTIEWIGDNKERTVKDLTDDSDGIFDELTLSSVLDLKPTDNKVMISLAYGKSSHYTVSGDKFIMNPVAYTLVGSTIYNDEYEPVLENATATDGVYTLTQDETTVYLKETDGVLYSYETKEKAIAGNASDRITYKKTVLNDLKGGGASDLIGSIELGAALDVEITDLSDELLHALAFGYEDEHFKLGTDNSVEWLVQDESTGKPYAPRTIDDLSNNSDEIFNSIRLATVLNIKIENTSSDKLLHALAFGYENEHFKLGTDNSVEWLTDENGTEYFYRTIDDLKNNSEAIFDDLRLATVLDVTPTSHEIIIALAYGKEGREFEYVDSNNDGTIDENDENNGFQSIAPYKPHTVKELKEGGGKDLLDNIELSSIFYKPDPEEDKVQMFILYGTENVHYSVENGEVTMLQKRVAICRHADHKKVYDEYGHHIKNGSVTEYTGEGDYDYVYTDPNEVKYYLKKVDVAPFTELTDDSTDNDPYSTADFYFVYNTYGTKVMFTERTLGQLTRDKTLLDDISKALTVRDFLGDDAGLDENFVLKHVADHKIDELPHAIENLTVQEVFAEEIYDENDEITGTWKYLLYKNGVEQEYKLSEIASMIENMKENVKKATLQELYTDGLIRTEPDELIADFTIDDLIAFVATLQNPGNS